MPKAMAILLSAGRNSNERVHFVQRKCSKANAHREGVRPEGLQTSFI